MINNLVDKGDSKKNPNFKKKIKVNFQKPPLNHQKNPSSSTKKSIKSFNTPPIKSCSSPQNHNFYSSIFGHQKTQCKLSIPISFHRSYIMYLRITKIFGKLTLIMCASFSLITFPVNSFYVTIITKKNSLNAVSQFHFQ